MNKYFGIMFFSMILTGCNPHLDKEEYDKHCKGDDCYIHSTKTAPASSPCSGAWATSTKCFDGGANPGSGGEVFGGSSQSSPTRNVDDIPEDGTGNLGDSKSAPGVGQSGGSGFDGKPGEGSSPVNDGSVIGGNGGGSPDKGDHDPKPLTALLNSVSDGFKGVVGEFNGNNNKKRKKARDAKRLLNDASDTIRQVTDLGKHIDEESSSMGLIGNGLLQKKYEFEAATSDQAFEDIGNRYNEKSKGILDKTPDFDEGPNPGSFANAKGVYYENQKIASGHKYVKFAKDHIEKFKGQPDYEARKGLVEMADEALTASEGSYKGGEPSEGSAYYEVAIALADIALSVTPVIGVGKDAWELATGTSLIDGHTLTTFERSMAGVGIATLGFAKLGVIGKLGKLGRIISRGSTGAEDAAKVAKSLERGEEIAVAAERAGADRHVVEEIAEAVKDGFPCKVASLSPLDRMLSVFEEVAYAADCLPGSIEDKVVALLDNGAKEGIKGETLGRVQSRINIRTGSASETGSGLDYALKNHGGSGPTSKSQFSVAKDKIKDILGRKDIVSSPVLKSSDSGNFVRQFDTGEIFGNLPINKGADPTSVITVITDEAGNLVNTFPGSLGRGAQLK